MKATIERTPGSFFHTIEALIENKKALYTEIGIDAVAYCKESFTLQRLGNRQWKRPSNPNLAGIWSDAENNRSSPSRRFADRNALIDTGRLRSSITYSVQNDGIVIGTNVPYARLQHKGGVSVLKKSNANFDQNIDKIIRSNRSKLSEKNAHRIYALKSLTQLSIKVPARPFLGYTKQRLEKIVNEHMKELAGKK